MDDDKVTAEQETNYGWEEVDDVVETDAFNMDDVEDVDAEDIEVDAPAAGVGSSATSATGTASAASGHTTSASANTSAATDSLTVEHLEVVITGDDIDPNMDLSEDEALAYRIIRRAAAIGGVRIDRDAFLRTELAKHCPPSMVDAAVETTTQRAGVPMEIMDEVADAAIDFETKKVVGLSALAGIPGGLAILGTIPADLVNYFAHVLRIEQKLAYIYGWPTLLNDEGKIDDNTMFKLILFLGVVLRVDGIDASLTNFAAHTTAVGIARSFWYPILKKVMAAVGAKVTKKSLANFAAKGVPLLGGAISGGITWATYKPGARSLKNHLRLLPQATGGVVDEAELESELEAESEREDREFARAQEEAAERVNSAAAAAAAASERVSSAATAASERANAAAAAASERMSSAANAASERVSNVTSAASERINNATDAASEKARSAGKSLTELVSGIASWLSTQKKDDAPGDGIVVDTVPVPGSVAKNHTPTPESSTNAEPASTSKPVTAKPAAPKPDAPTPAIAQELRLLKSLRDGGLISQDYYEAQEAKLLNQ